MVPVTELGPGSVHTGGFPAETVSNRNPCHQLAQLLSLIEKQSRWPGLVFLCNHHTLPSFRGPLQENSTLMRSVIWLLPLRVKTLACSCLRCTSLLQATVPPKGKRWHGASSSKDAWKHTLADPWPGKSISIPGTCLPSLRSRVILQSRNTQARRRQRWSVDCNQSSEKSRNASDRVSAGLYVLLI